MGNVRVAGAHLHNLKNVDVEFPREKLVAFTGISGSGKSSLAFGTIHGESQRRYLESVAPFARRLIGKAVDPKVDQLSGMPPTVALEQRTSAGGARSSVGTLTNLSNGLRLIYSRAGDHPADVLEQGSVLHGGRLTAENFSPNTTEGMCPECHGTGVLMQPTEDSMVPDPRLSIADGAIAAWPGAWLGKNFRDILRTLGVDIEKPWKDLPKDTREWILYTDEDPVVTVHPIRGPEARQGSYQGRWVSVSNYLKHTLSNSKAESSRKRVLPFFSIRTCPLCHGHRLNQDALRVTYLGHHIYELTAWPLDELSGLLVDRLAALPETEGTPEEEAERILLPTLIPVLRTVVGLGLGHLSMGRAAPTLSTGEIQRLRLAAQLRAGLYGVAYVLDEPSAGLHPTEKNVLVDLFRGFIEEGNSVLLVEHDLALIQQSDWVIDVGPGAGSGGGEILYSGDAEGLHDVADSATAAALRQPAPTLVNEATARTPQGELTLRGITSRTLRDVDATFPLASMTSVTGVSGSGKSTLVSHVLGTVLAQRVTTTVGEEEEAEDAPSSILEDAEERDDSVHVREVSGAEDVDRLVLITQRPIGRTPRSCLATYTGLFDRVRRLFADTAAARERGWGVGRFSFNVAEGRCPECSGMGQIEVELIFLPGSYATCPVCHGTRYKPETLEVTWNGKSIADVLEMTVAQAREFFADEPRVRRALDALAAIGLGYLTLGQPATELSGGEAQRIKLANELQRAVRARTVYLLDEPTAGLHPADVRLLLAQLQRLVDAGSTVVVAEHDLRVIAASDRVIDLGPGAGERGGRVVAAGTPAHVAQDPDSATGRWLKDHSRA